MHFQLLTLCFVSWQLFNRYYGSCRHFFHLEEKILPQTYPSEQQKHLKHGYFYALTIVEFLSLFPGSFALIVVSTGISVFGGKSLPKTHVGLSVAFLTTKTPARWIAFMFCRTQTLCLIFWWHLDSHYGLYRYFFHL